MRLGASARMADTTTIATITTAGITTADSITTVVIDTSNYTATPIAHCMKHISKLLLIVIAFVAASCAHREPATQTVQTTTTTGYTK